MFHAILNSKKISSAIFIAICFVLLLFLHLPTQLTTQNSLTSSDIKANSILKIRGKELGFPHKRLLNYCSRDPIKGAEGKYIDDSKFKLISLVIAHRHGDRSSIHSIKNAKHTQPSSKINDRPILYEPSITSELDSAKYFTINVLKPGPVGDSGSKNFAFTHALDLKALFTTSDTLLPQGQLTSIGYMQLLHLGSHLQQSYTRFLSGIKESEVCIRSTNYHRTIQVRMLYMHTVYNCILFISTILIYYSVCGCLADQAASPARRLRSRHSHAI